MKLFPRLLAGLLAAATLGVFASCGANESVESTTAKATDSAVETTVKSNSAAATTTVKATAKQAQSVTNMKGYATIGELISRTKNKKGNASDSFVKSLKGYKLNVMQAWEPAKSGKIYDSNKYCMNEVEKQYGVKINVGGFFLQYNEQLTAKLTSRSAEAQIYMVQNFNYASYFKNGYLCDLSMAMSKAGVDFKDPWYNQNSKNFLNVNYKQYGWVAYGAEYTFPYGILYNKNLIKKAKLTDIEDLVKNGKWTWANLEKYAKKLNTANIVGFGVADTSLMLASMSATKGGTLVNVKKGKSPTSNIDAQVNKDCLAQLVKWCKNGGICNTFSKQDWTYPKTQFSAGKVAMLYCSHDAIKNTLTNKSFKDSIGFVPFPTQTATKKYTNICIPQFIWFIPSQHKSEAAKALFVNNELMRQQYRFSQRNFEINWKSYFDDKDTIDMECNMMYSRGMFHNVYDWRSVCETGKTQTSSIINLAISSGGVQNAIDTYKTALDKSYKSVWDGFRITGDL